MKFSRKAAKNARKNIKIFATLREIKVFDILLTPTELTRKNKKLV